MCNKNNDFSSMVNTFFTFLFMIYSCLMLTDVTFSQSIALSTNEIEEALFLGAEMENDTNKKLNEKQGDSATAWFGPRLGRKKRSLTLDDEPLEMLDNKMNHKTTSDEAVLQYLKNYPWILVPIIGEEYVSKRQVMKPRLGRANAWSDDEEKMIKAPPFSPRLGRRSLIPLKPRLGRAGNNPETAVFKPRLGRDPNFNEFSEYIADARNNIDGKDH